MVQPRKIRVSLPERIHALGDLRPLGAKGWRLVAAQVARETRKAAPSDTGNMR